MLAACCRQRGLWFRWMNMAVLWKTMANIHNGSSVWSLEIPASAKPGWFVRSPASVNIRSRNWCRHMCQRSGQLISTARTLRYKELTLSVCGLVAYHNYQGLPRLAFDRDQIAKKMLRSCAIARYCDRDHFKWKLVYPMLHSQLRLLMVSVSNLICSRAIQAASRTLICPRPLHACTKDWLY